MPVLSHKVRSLFDYFRQQFAQVTNPPIDPLRESIVMSLQTQIGPECNIFVPAPEHARQIVLGSPDPLAAQAAPDPRARRRSRTNSSTCSTTPAEGLAERASRACARRRNSAVREGKLVLLLSDRYLVKGKLPAHALLVTGAVHQHLVTTGLRCKCNLLVETGTARDPHHFACLIGYGATAVYPYMAYQVLFEMMRGGHGEARFRRAPRARTQLPRRHRKGLFKIMSKMGISTIASYRSSQLFEIVGLADEVVHAVLHRHREPRAGRRLRRPRIRPAAARRARRGTRASRIEQGGLLKYVHGGEYHMYNPDVIAALQAAVHLRRLRPLPQFAAAREHAARPPRCATCWRCKTAARAASRSKKSSRWRRSCARFDSAGMSLGALSPEAHEALAIAMNRLGARSNSGEGGEDPARYRTEKNSKIKQVASGPLRRDPGVPDQRRGAADQDRAGRQARRGRPAARRTRSTT